MAKENVIKERESKTDIAYRLMLKKKKERNFYDLWEEVKAELAKVLEPEEIVNVDEDISFFYTNLTLDGRFVNVGENKWDLRERVTFDKVHIDMNDFYADDEDEGNQNKDSESDEEGNEKSDYSSDYITDDFEDSFDDSTGSDADIEQYREHKSYDDEDEDL